MRQCQLHDEDKVRQNSLSYADGETVGEYMLDTAKLGFLAAWSDCAEKSISAAC